MNKALKKKFGHVDLAQINPNEPNIAPDKIKYVSLTCSLSFHTSDARLSVCGNVEGGTIVG